MFGIQNRGGSLSASYIIWLYGLTRSYHGVLMGSYEVYRGLLEFRAHPRRCQAALLQIVGNGPDTDGYPIFIQRGL